MLKMRFELLSYLRLLHELHLIKLFVLLLKPYQELSGLKTYLKANGDIFVSINHINWPISGLAHFCLHGRNRPAEIPFSPSFCLHGRNSQNGELFSCQYQHSRFTSDARPNWLPPNWLPPNHSPTSPIQILWFTKYSH